MATTSASLDAKELLAAGAHFGHRVSRWNPNMRPFIYTTKNGTHIIDLEKTIDQFDVAVAALKNVIEAGGQVLLVGAKKQVKNLLPEIAATASQPYVIERWIGGTLTNNKSISSRIQHMKELEQLFETKEIERYTKKEQSIIKKELEELQRKYNGIRDLKGLPSMMFVVDLNKDAIAVREAKKMGVPVVGLADTNTDPTAILHAIPCNDDAVKTLQYVLGRLGEELAKAHAIGVAKREEQAAKAGTKNKS